MVSCAVQFLHLPDTEWQCSSQAQRQQALGQARQLLQQGLQPGHRQLILLDDTMHLRCSALKSSYVQVMHAALCVTNAGHALAEACATKRGRWLPMSGRPLSPSTCQSARCRHADFLRNPCLQSRRQMVGHRAVRQKEACARNAARPMEQRVPQEVLLAHFGSLEAPQPARFHWESSCVVLQSGTEPELVRLLPHPLWVTVLLHGTCLGPWCLLALVVSFMPGA